MTTDEFEDLVLKYLDGQTTSEEAADLNRQLTSDPAKADFFVRISKTETWVQAHHATESPFDEKLPHEPRLLRTFAIAAGILVAILAVVFFSSTTKTDPPRPLVRLKIEKVREEMTRIEEESRQAQKQLAALPPPKTDGTDPARREAEAALARIEERRREAEKTIEQATPEPPPPKPPSTVVAVATVERVEGTVSSAAGQVLVAGQRLETGPRSQAWIVYGDGTRLEVGAETVLRDFQDRTAGKGRRVTVDRGSLAADVAKQDPPMVFATPQGEARVLGTQLSLVVAETTRLEVKEGRVKFQRADGRSIEVPAGNYTVSSDLKLVSSRILLHSFEAQPAWATTFDAPWGKPARFLGVSGGLQGSRTELGSSARVVVVSVPANTLVEVSARLRCPRASGGFWMELALRPGDHAAEDFDTNSKAWTLVKKFDSYAGPNGNNNVWTRYSKQVATGAATKLSIGFKLGATGSGDYSAAWDSLRVQY